MSSITYTTPLRYDVVSTVGMVETVGMGGRKRVLVSVGFRIPVSR